MVDFNQIIIGAGTSAYTFLYYAYIGGSSRRSGKFDPKKLGKEGGVLIIGDSDLWADVNAADPDHKIGQPPHLLRLPHQNNVGLSKQFMPTKEYVQRQKQLQAAAKSDLNVTTWKTKARKVLKAGDRYIVLTTDNRMATANQVIVAATGPQQRPKTLAGLPDDNDKMYRRCIDAVSYMNSEQPKVKTVCIHGASATSSWAVKRAIKSGVENIIWVARSGFSEANPAGRNNDVIKEGLQKGWMTIGDFEKIEVAGLFPASANTAEHDPTVNLHFAKYGTDRIAKTKGDLIKKAKGGASIYQIYKKNEMEFLSGEDDNYVKVLEEDGKTYKRLQITSDGVVAVNQYVYALGAQSLAAAIGDDSVGILSSGIAHNLAPVFDVDHRFGDKGEDTVVAFTDGANLWVVGAAVFRTGPQDVGSRYANVTQMMPKGGQPPEGIAGVVASIKVLIGVHDLRENVDPTLADFQELEKWADWIYQDMKKQIPSQTELGYPSLPPAVRRFIADQIVALRKHTTFGTEHLKDNSIKALEETVRALLSNEESLSAFAPKDLLKKWEPKMA
jgi:hypothetical protein